MTSARKRGDERDAADVSTRRHFLRALGAAGVGTVGVRTAPRTAAARNLRGVPLVWTRDRFGDPDRVRLVSKERHRRLRTYRDLDLDKLHDRYAGIEGVTLEARSDGGADLAFEVLLDRNRRVARRRLPNRINRIPVTLAEATGTTANSGGEDCHRADKHYDPLVANAEIQGKDDGDDGTLGLIGWTTNERDPRLALVTAWHVVKNAGEPADEILQHSGWVGATAETVDVGRLSGFSELRDDGMDVVRYLAIGDYDLDPLATASDRQPDVSGTWTFAGLTDATSGEASVDVSIAGATTCYAEGEVVTTLRGGHVDYEARTRNEPATNGDSGGAFVDDEGNIAFFFSQHGSGYNAGGVADEALDRLNVRLHNGGFDY